MPTLPELGLILFIVLVIFGAGRVNRVGDLLGNGVRALLGRRD